MKHNITLAIIYCCTAKFCTPCSHIAAPYAATANIRHLC